MLAAGAAGGTGGEGAAGGTGGEGAAGGTGGEGAAGGTGGEGAAGGTGGEGGTGGMAQPDTDMDNIADVDDNCPEVANPEQEDADMDEIGDVCDDDRDGDTYANDMDNCADVANEDQADLDMDGAGDVCDDDRDGDMAPDDMDNCPDVANGDQADMDEDMVGDVCDDDADGDMIPNDMDNCALAANEDQVDMDGDMVGDVCDDDIDGDEVANADDNCPLQANADQLDSDMDGAGDVCDEDDDNDERLDEDDNCPTVANVDQADSDLAPTAQLDVDGAGEARVLSDAALEVALGDDAASDEIDIGFAFEFFGQAYETLRIGSNGIISFTGEGASYFSPSRLYSADSTDAVIAACWTDIAANTVRYETLGEAPNREFVVAWDAPGFGGSLGGASQIVLREEGGGELFVTRCPDNGGQGVESQQGEVRAVTDGRPAPAVAFTTGAETDGVGDACDNCPNAWNADQLNSDDDADGDA